MTIFLALILVSLSLTAQISIHLGSLFLEIPFSLPFYGSVLNIIMSLPMQEGCCIC